MGKWCLHASFLIESSSNLLVTRTGIKAWTSSISGLWFPWLIYMFLKWDLILAHWTQVSDRCPLGYLYLFGPHFDLYQSFNRLPVWNSQNCRMFPLAFVAGWLQGHWWGFISRNYVVWPTFLLMDVCIALKGSHFWFLFIGMGERSD